MKAQWEQWSIKVMAMSQRERLMVLAAALALIWVVCDTLVLSPQLKKQKAYRDEIALKRDEASKLQAQQVAVINAAKFDPDADKRQRLDELRGTIADIDTELQKMQRELITPARMPQVLENVLQRDRAIRLVALETLPMAAMQSLTQGEGADAAKPGAAPKTTAAAPVGIYKHAFRIRVEGGYLDLIRYVQALENSRWKMNWDDLKLEAGAYPKSTLTLTLYTLSLDQAWLSI